MGTFDAKSYFIKITLQQLQEDFQKSRLPYSFKNFPDVPVDADAPPLNFGRADRIAAVDTGVRRPRVLSGHAPKRVLDDPGRVVADAEFEVEHPPGVRADKIRVSRGGGVPALVLDKAVVRAQIHRHRLAAMRAFRNQLGRDFHILLPLHHLSNRLLVVKSFLTAGLGALEQPVVALSVEKPRFVESRFLKTVVDVGRDDEVILIFYHIEQHAVNRLRRVGVAVDEDVSRPVRPKFFGSFVRIKPARVHIRKAVFSGKIGEIFIEPFARIGKAGRGG